MSDVQTAVSTLEDRLSRLGWVRDLLVAGSLATGDYVPAVSDLDLVAIVEGPVDAARVAVLSDLHRSLDAGSAAGLRLGCLYVDETAVADRTALHPTWTHGGLVHRTLSGVTRAELARHGFAVMGRAPLAVLAPVTDDDVREAAREELSGYWAWASRRPTMWLDPAFAELSLTSMARGGHALRTGDLLVKTRAIEETAAPEWLIARLRRRRSGESVALPRVRTAWIAWRDARHTVSVARRELRASRCRRP